MVICEEGGTFAFPMALENILAVQGRVCGDGGERGLSDPIVVSV